MKQKKSWWTKTRIALAVIFVPAAISLIGYIGGWFTGSNEPETHPINLTVSQTNIDSGNKPQPPSVNPTASNGKPKANRDNIEVKGNSNTITTGNNNTVDQSTHVVKGDNYGVNGDVTVVDEKTIHPDMPTILEFETKISKDEVVVLNYEAGQAKKNKAYCIELAEILIKRGYKSVHVSNGMIMTNPDKPLTIERSPNGSWWILISMY